MSERSSIAQAVDEKIEQIKTKINKSFFIDIEFIPYAQSL
jgi:hypothetical protein